MALERLGAGPDGSKWCGNGRAQGWTVPSGAECGRAWRWAWHSAVRRAELGSGMGTVGRKAKRFQVVRERSDAGLDGSEWCGCGTGVALGMALGSLAGGGGQWHGNGRAQGRKVPSGAGTARRGAELFRMVWQMICEVGLYREAEQKVGICD